MNTLVKGTNISLEDYVKNVKKSKYVERPPKCIDNE